MKRMFGDAETLFVNDTYQFDDYTKYESSAFSEEHKRNIRDTVFPKDMENAYLLGTRLV